MSLDEEDGVRMTLVEHLEEFRSRLIKSLAALAVAVTATLPFMGDLADVMLIPHFRAMSMLDPVPSSGGLIAGSHAGPAIAMLKLALLAGIVLASPAMGYQAWAFVGAGLYRRERRAVALFAPVSFLLFLLGVAFGYFVLIPYTLYGLVRMLPSAGVAPLFEFSGYLDLVLMLTLVLGGIFQLPLVMVFLSKAGLVEPSTYRSKRHPAVVAILVAAAVLTPGDGLSMIALALPMLALYEAGACGAMYVARST